MTNLKEMMAAARSVVEKITPDRAFEMAEQGALILDVRDAPEVQDTGRPQGSHHVSRGMLEFRADPDSPFHDPEFRKDRPIVLLCASGGRAFLAGKVLKEMGFQDVYNLGGFKDWKDAGLPVEGPADTSA